MKKSIDGFTLIELLVVITIIAILAAIGITAYGSLLKNARDTKRQSDLRLIQSALQRYFADQGFYPAVLGNCTTGTCVIDFAFTGTLTNATGISPSPAVTKTYLSTFPHDPLSTRSYVYKALKSNMSDFCAPDDAKQCTRYCLYASMENTPDSISNCPDYLGAYGFKLTSPD